MSSFKILALQRQMVNPNPGIQFNFEGGNDFKIGGDVAFSLGAGDKFACGHLPNRMVIDRWDRTVP